MRARLTKWWMPGGLYVDRDSIYRCEGLGSVAEQMAGQGPQTQFGRAMAALGVELILAYSPQAKGRAERMNGVLQDRLVKALRLAELRDLAAAHEFLARTFLPAFNRQFNVVAANPTDVHGAVLRDLHEGRPERSAPAATTAVSVATPPAGGRGSVPARSPRRVVGLGSE